MLVHATFSLRKGALSRIIPGSITQPYTLDLFLSLVPLNLVVVCLQLYAHPISLPISTMSESALLILAESQKTVNWLGDAGLQKDEIVACNRLYFPK